MAFSACNRAIIPGILLLKNTKASVFYGFLRVELLPHNKENAGKIIKKPWPL